MAALGLARVQTGRLDGLVDHHGMPGGGDRLPLGLSADRTGEDHGALFGAGGGLRHLARVPLMTQRRNDFLRHKDGFADGAMAALGFARVQAGGLYRLVGRHGVLFGGDLFRLRLPAYRTGKGRFASLLTGGGAGHFTLIPLVRKPGDGFRSGRAAVGAGIGFYTLLLAGGRSGNDALVPLMVPCGGDGLRFCFAADSAGIADLAFLFRRRLFCHNAVIPPVAGGFDGLLRCDDRAADGAVAAPGFAVRRAGGGDGLICRLGVAFGGDLLRFCLSANPAGIGRFPFFRAGRFLSFLALIPGVGDPGDGFRFRRAAVEAGIGLYAIRFTGGGAGDFALVPLMVSGGGDWLRFCFAADSAGIGGFAFLFRRRLFCHHAVIPPVAGGFDSLLRCDDRAADGAVAARGFAVRRAGGGDGLIRHLGVAPDGDLFCLCLLTGGTGEGLHTFFRAGGFRCYPAPVPFVSGGFDGLLRCNDRAADGAVAARRFAVRRAGGGNGLIRRLGMAFGGDLLRFRCLAVRAGKGLYARLRAGGFLGHDAVVPDVLDRFHRHRVGALRRQGLVRRGRHGLHRQGVVGAGVQVADLTARLGHGGQQLIRGRVQLSAVDAVFRGAVHRLPLQRNGAVVRFHDLHCGDRPRGQQCAEMFPRAGKGVVAVLDADGSPILRRAVEVHVVEPAAAGEGGFLNHTRITGYGQRRQRGAAGERLPPMRLTP